MACLSERASIHRTVLAVHQRRHFGEQRGALCRRLAAGGGIGTLSESGTGESSDRADKSCRITQKPLDLQGRIGRAPLAFSSSYSCRRSRYSAFVFLQEPFLALRISNAIAVIMLFGLGYTFGRLTGYRPVPWPCNGAAGNRAGRLDDRVGWLRQGAAKSSRKSTLFAVHAGFRGSVPYVPTFPSQINAIVPWR
jgi:hypothetical protein